MSLYSLKVWKSLRAEQLRANPFCAFCDQVGNRTPATVVDHIVPHKGDRELFFDASNLQSLCKTCHDGVKKRFEMSGIVKGSDASGIPLDPNHHWHQEAAA